MTGRYATTEDWLRFLAPIAASVRNPPDRSEITARAAACADALAIFAEWLTLTRRRDAMAAWQFWPAVADIAEIFAADKRHAAFMRAATAPRLPPPEPAATERPTPEQIEANRAKVAALKAELAADLHRDRPSAGPAYLAPHHLLAGYEAAAAQGNTAAAYRAAQIRKELAA
jgi:hypothetical protein